jgi:peptide-methionine (S)-S-oxide reductase
VEAEFRKLRGVVSTTVGYTGGNFRDPTYFDVCTDVTGHAEAVQIEFDPAQISYERLLEVFWSIHDPTSVNRQGADVGSQYRSAIFFHTHEQEAAARRGKDLLTASGKYQRSVATEIVPTTAFYRAEGYHQRHFEKHAVANWPG